MSISINPAYARCNKKNCYVSLEQTEGQCREKHACSDDACPLESELGQNRFSTALNMLAANIGQSFAKPTGR
jgi:hypothetical protein